MPDELIQSNLEGILKSIDVILERFVDINNADDFMITPVGGTKMDSIAMRLQVIGELLKKIEKIDPGYLIKFTEIDWKEIMKLRDLISHHYDVINPVLIFDICKIHLPNLKKVIEKIIKEN
jgi:uncharacterized protein with HEPN domain